MHGVVIDPLGCRRSAKLWHMHSVGIDSLDGGRFTRGGQIRSVETDPLSQGKKRGTERKRKRRERLETTRRATLSVIPTIQKADCSSMANLGLVRFDTEVPLRYRLLNPLGRRGNQVFAGSARLRLAFIAPTRLPLVSTLGFEMDILEEKPQDLKGAF
jgi:hypothetical protein